MTGGEELDVDAIEHRLDEMLDDARANGMSREGLAVADEMVKKKFRGVWRLKLLPGEVADLPALSIELEGDEDFQLPKPYRRTYTQAEIRWWRTHMAELRQAGVVRRSSAKQLAPSNLVPKNWRESSSTMISG